MKKKERETQKRKTNEKQYMNKHSRQKKKKQ